MPPAVDRHTTAPDVPLWARQMEIFILEDMNELEAARIHARWACSQAGSIQDPAEARFLEAAAAGTGRAPGATQLIVRFSTKLSDSDVGTIPIS